MAEPGLEAHARLNALEKEAARAALLRCCGVIAWAEAMLAHRPFASTPALLAAADALFFALDTEQKREAFAHHPEIGANLAELRARFQSTAALSVREQAGVSSADDATLARLRDGNAAYKARFGYVFIVCASGKSAQEMLELLTARLDNDPKAELELAAAELAKITRLRLEKIEG
jgi:2-oxo-4-hydroxy-4-carboxy-5-ureidoimidazoline decarboxylase